MYAEDAVTFILGNSVTQAKELTDFIAHIAERSDDAVCNFMGPK